MKNSTEYGLVQGRGLGGLPVVVGLERSRFVESEVANLFITQLRQMCVKRRQVETGDVLV